VYTNQGECGTIGQSSFKFAGSFCWCETHNFSHFYLIFQDEAIQSISVFSWKGLSFEMASGHAVKTPKARFAPQGHLSAHEFELAMQSKPQKAHCCQSFNVKFERFASQGCLSMRLSE
jgi:hypothetical protein